MIKILFLIPNLGHGGAERVLVNLVNHMDKSKYDITVQTMFDVGIYRDKLAAHVKYKGGFPWYFRGNTIVYKLFSPRFLFKRHVKEHYDIIVSYLEGPSARVVSGCNDNTVKLVCWIHGEQHTIKYLSSVFRNENEALNSYRKFHRIACVAETVKDDFSSLVPLEAPIEVIYNCVETDVIRAKKSEAIDDVLFSKDVVNICSVAKLMKIKGYDRLVNIQRKLKDEGIPTHVYIIGKGEELEPLTAQVRENGLEQDWTFVGFRDNPYKYVAACDLYVCSSRREGFSTAVTESLIVGTPVVSTDCSGARELLGENNEYGIVTGNDENALYSGLKRMLTEDGLLAHYKKQAEIRGMQFQIDQTVQQAEKMFEEVLSK